MKKAPARNEGDAKARLLKAAWELFAQKGVEYVSLRALTARAKVNVAAVSYHFGSRAALEEAVFDVVAGRVNAERVAGLEQLLEEARCGGRRPDAERIVDCFVRPYLDPAHPDGLLLAQLVLKHRLAPTAMTRRLVRRHFDPLARRFVAALAEALPEVEPTELYWRYMFMSVTAVLMATDRRKANRVAAISDHAVDAADPAALRAAMTRFLVAGFAA